MAATSTIDTPGARSPRGTWLLGHARMFQRDRLGFLAECARDHGDVVALRLGPSRVRVVNHPDLVEEVLVTRNRQFIKHFALRIGQAHAGQRAADQRGGLLATPAEARAAGLPPRADRRATPT